MPRRAPRFYVIRQRDGRFVSCLDSPIEWSRTTPLAFKRKRDAQAVVRERLDAAVDRLGIKIVRL